MTEGEKRIEKAAHVDNTHDFMDMCIKCGRVNGRDGTAVNGRAICKECNDEQKRK